MSSDGGRARGDLRRHGGALATVGVLSGLGILATSGFHVVTGRGLGPAAFGLLAAFLAIVNIAAIGSSALQNSVAVATARALHAPRVDAGPRRRWMDSSAIEALVLGGIGTIVVVLAAPLLADWLRSSTLALFLAALSILPGFVFSRAQGILQGAGDARSVAAWSTGSQLLRLLLAAAAIAAGLGAVTVLLAVLAAIAAVAVGATIQASRLRVSHATVPFTAKSIVVLLLVISFAWLTNIDVVLVRGGASELESGSFAAAAVIIKMILLVPTTLSLYLLPRFVNRQGDHATVRYGVNVLLGTILLGGLAMALAVTFFGGLITLILFGSGYDLAAQYLPLMAVAYLPWAMAQGMLIQLTASASRTGLATLIVAAILQWVGASLVLPNIWAMIALMGALGTVVLLVFFIRFIVTTRGKQVAPSES